jgi:hypothetical protein
VPFPAMHEIVPAGIVGAAQVVHDRPSQLEIIRHAMKGGYTEDRVHTRLLVHGTLMMTDANFEHRTNYEVVRQSGGDVLIAGLGIGMILTRILAKEQVRSVTVIEKYGDVIRLVQPHHHSPKLTVIESDIFSWRPEKGVKFDAIYFDIWPNLCTDNLEQMTAMHRAFRKFLRAGGWMDSWCRNYLRAEKRREARSGW